MTLDNPAWRSAPLTTGIRVVKSLIRRAVPGYRHAVVAYDGGRCLLHADLDTPLGLGLYRYGYRDPDIDLAARLLVPGDVFVDGGAHIGLFTLVAATRVGKEGKVIAFEPSSVVRPRLVANVELNGFSQVEVVPRALSSRVGTATFRTLEFSGSGFSHLGASNEKGDGFDSVEVTTLDATLTSEDKRRLRLVKLDLEGAEHQALLGATELLTSVRPDLLLEVEPSHLARMGTTPAELEALLFARGYRLFRTGTAPDGSPSLDSLSGILAGAPYPNVFASVDPERVRARGVVMR